MSAFAWIRGGEWKSPDGEGRFGDETPPAGPPGEDEIAPEQLESFEQLIREQCGSGAEAVFETMERFEQARPADPHFYLSLLGTHDDSRGRGIAVAELPRWLARTDGGTRLPDAFRLRFAHEKNVVGLPMT